MSDELRMMLAGLLLRLEEVQGAAGRESLAADRLSMAVRCTGVRYAVEAAMELIPPDAPRPVQ